MWRLLPEQPAGKWGLTQGLGPGPLKLACSVLSSCTPLRGFAAPLTTSQTIRQCQETVICFSRGLAELMAQLSLRRRWRHVHHVEQSVCKAELGATLCSPITIFHLCHVLVSMHAQQ